MADAEEKEGADAAAPKVAQATLELKAYDPESGVVLKFKTNRAAEVGRLMLGLGSLGRYMAALPVKEEGMRILKMAFGGGSMLTICHSSGYSHGRCCGS